MKIAKRIFLTGSLQSLYFRTFVKEHANRFSIKGYVRKTEDSKVEVFMQGEPEKISAFMEICKKGPEHSIIRNIEERDEKLQDFREFKILNF